MARSPVRHFKDSCVIQGLSETKNLDTSELESVWWDVETCDCLVVHRADASGRDVTGDNEVTSSRYSLMLPPGLTIAGESLDLKNNRVGRITYHDGTILDGPFRILDISPSRGVRRHGRYISLALEKLNQE